MKREMVQVEMIHDSKKGGFVLTISPVRSRWIKYGGTIGNKRCSFCNGWFENGEMYYQSKANGSLCVGHAAFLLGATPEG